jgi:hypothetical protein
MMGLGLGLGWLRHGPAGPSAPAPYVGPLDGIPTYSAVAMRKLYSAYGGPCIRVRRTSDNAEFDIGFAGPSQRLDEADLLAQIGSNNAAIVSRYDHSGNGRHWTQPSAGSQPRIVSAGVIDRDTQGRPTAVFDGVDDYMGCQSAQNFTNGQSGATIAGIATFFSANATRPVASFSVASAGTARFLFGRRQANDSFVQARNPDNGSAVTTPGGGLTSNIQARLIGRMEIGVGAAVFRDGLKSTGAAPTGTTWPATGSAAAHMGRSDAIYLSGDVPFLALVQGVPDDTICAAIDAAMASLQA